MPAKPTALTTAPRHAGLTSGGKLCRLLTGMTALLLLAACSSQPHRSPAPPNPSRDDRTQQVMLVQAAIDQLQRPYRYGGASPAGFDCSGLVYYVYRLNGISIPRTTHEQQLKAHPVRLSDLAPGDLIFFHQQSRKPHHVGLYIGEGRFIHASTSQREVILSPIDTPYWQSKRITAGRYGY